MIKFSTVIPVEKVYDFCKDLDMWQKDFGKDIEGYVNHIPETSAFLKEAKLKKFDFIGIQTVAGECLQNRLGAFTIS